MPVAPEPHRPRHRSRQAHWAAAPDICAEDQHQHRKSCCHGPVVSVDQDQCLGYPRGVNARPREPLNENSAISDVLWLRHDSQEDQDMTPKFISRSFVVTRSSILVCGMVVGLSISTNAETVKLMDQASAQATKGSSSSPKPTARTAGIPGRTAVRRMGPLVRTSATANSRDARVSLGAAGSDPLPKVGRRIVCGRIDARRSNLIERALTKVTALEGENAKAIRHPFRLPVSIFKTKTVAASSLQSGRNNNCRRCVSA